MSVVQGTSETADSFVPTVRDGNEAEPTMYKCRNCGREADADSDRCPNCSSENLRPIHL